MVWLKCKPVIELLSALAEIPTVTDALTGAVVSEETVPALEHLRAPAPEQGYREPGGCMDARFPVSNSRSLVFEVLLAALFVVLRAKDSIGTGRCVARSLGPEVQTMRGEARR